MACVPFSLDYAHAAMFDATKLRAELGAAVEKFSSKVAQLLADEVEIRRIEVGDHGVRTVAALSSSTPALRSEYVDPTPAESTPPIDLDRADDLARQVVDTVATSPIPPTFRKLRQRLRAKAVVLRPVVDRLVADGRICAVHLADVVLYELPRVEPIRRRRSQTE